jgi:exodeoxyribonuclease VII large subunit
MPSTTEPNTQASPAQILSVEQLNLQIKQLIEGQLSSLWVRGEISNFKAHTSGHFYFSIKDAKSQISAVMFRGHNGKLKFKPADGMEVILRGKITVYEPRGNYQILCDMMEPVGAGALQKAYEDLRNKLKAEGLFDPARKRKVPEYPRHVAVVTSPTGAAIQDILNILSRRAPSVRITIVPTLVQGASAAPQIIAALAQAEKLHDVDCVILGRGGGSMEDLWAFNNEELARVIANFPRPIISAVGHEVDFTIADFVADLRAPTPSAAAELVAKSSAELQNKILSMEKLLHLAIEKRIQNFLQKVAFLNKSLVDPRKKFVELIMRNDELMTRLQLAIRAYFKVKTHQLQMLKARTVNPTETLKLKKQKLKLLEQKFEKYMLLKFEKMRQKFLTTTSRLNALSPLAVVDRGYAILTAQDKVIKELKQVEIGHLINAKISDGNLTLQVTKKEGNQHGL